MIEYSEAWQSFRDFNFKNPLEGHFSFNKECFVGRTPAMVQSALHFPDRGKCFTQNVCVPGKINESFFIEGKVTFEWIFEIQVSEALPGFRMFYHSA